MIEVEVERGAPARLQLATSKADEGQSALKVLCVVLPERVCQIYKNKPIQDGGEAKAPLWLNRLSGTD